jgi:hypothetical protein
MSLVVVICGVKAFNSSKRMWIFKFIGCLLHESRFVIFDENLAIDLVYITVYREPQIC